MLETGGVACDSEKNTSQKPTLLGFNVANIQDALKHISKVDSDASIVEID